MASEVLSLVSQLEAAIGRVTGKDWENQDVNTKRKASDTLRKLSLDLEEWDDIVDRFIYSPMDNVMIRLGLDLGIFKILAKSHGPMTVDALGKEIKICDETLLRRICRTLGAMSAIGEVGTDTYEATNFTYAFDTEKGIAGQKFSFEFAAPAWNQMPYYLEQTKYRNPSDASNAPLQMAFNSNSHFFGLLVERPGILQTFSTFMTCHKRGRPEFPEVFPVEKELVSGFKAEDKEAVVFVDVGGGMGQEIEMLRQMVPEIPGRTVLQEVPDLVKEAAGKSGVEVMVHDFFTPQPIQGARAYYFRNIFHDWSDENCLKILNQTKSAMTPGYSRLLINDLVVTDQKEGLFMTRSDMNMLALLGSMERSESQWRKLLESAGFDIVKIWTKEARYESVIEAIVKGENDEKRAVSGSTV